MFLLACSAEPLLTDGPFVGHVDAQSIHVYARAAESGSIHAELSSANDTRHVAQEARGDADNMLRFDFTGLAADTNWTLRLSGGHGAQPVVRNISTPRADANAQALAFVSCADDLAVPRQPLWTRLGEAAIDGLVLLGDTPYINNTRLEVQRSRRRSFHRVPELKALLAKVPVWTTWDDHDYGVNDEFGAIAGRENSRQALLEWSALASAGENAQGIYTSFRRGPLEVFLIDARWFADTEADAQGRKSLLGSAQWKWLEDGLKASTAPFKILCTGLVWNEAVRPGKKDHWMHWPHERERLWRFIGTQKISGVVLVGGDLHRCRVFEHRSEELSGYRLPEFVSSPLAAQVIESNGPEHRDLIFDKGLAMAGLILRVRAEAPQVLEARFIDDKGLLFYEKLMPLSSLSPAAAPR
jgi:alkaline phosphatase D